MENKMKNYRNLCHLIVTKAAAVLFAVMFLAPLVLMNVQAETIQKEYYTDKDGVLLKVIDVADLLSDKEEIKLKEEIEEITTRQQLDIVIVTVNGLDGKTSTEFADDFYDYTGYGYGDENDGILLLVSMEDRDWAISTTGRGIEAFTDAGQEYITDEVVPYLSDGKYYKAFKKFVSLCDKFIEQADKGEPYDVNNLPLELFRWVWIPLGLFFGIGFALIKADKNKDKLTSVYENETAFYYTKDGSVEITKRTDEYVTKRTKKTPVARKSSSGSDSKGGSSTHKSSSGTTHGGSSGKF